MRGFLRSNTFKILLILTFMMSCILVLSNTVGNTHIASILGMAVTPMQEVSIDFTDEEKSKLSSISREDLERYYIELERENADLRTQLADYYTIKQENDQYEQALNVLSERPEFELKAATVISRDPSDPFYGFTINLGEEDMIAIGNPVITEEGLVGIVTDVYPTASKVTTILSESVNVGAYSKEFKESGVVTGDAESALNGLVRMNYLTKETKIGKDTLITTSGSGSTFPENLVIGKVSHLGSSNVDSTFYAIIEPFVDIKTVTDVLVITNFSDDIENENTSVGEE